MIKKESPTTITENKKSKYFLLTSEDVLKEIKKTTNEVNDILFLPSTTLVRLLLNYFHWDKDRLTEQFYEDPDALFKKINVANPHISPSLQWNPISPGVLPNQGSLLVTNTTSSNTICRICCSECTPNEIFALRCRHQHCRSCWQSYLESNIIVNGCAQSISCPSRCNQVIDDEEILDLLETNEQLCQRYRKLLVESFVQTNRLTHWCHGNSCSMIIKMQTYEPNCSAMIECDHCQLTSCFQCGKQWHEPIQCAILTEWEKKNQDESMNGKWILANTKECPNCKSNIEKNGGCNHMTCRKVGCGYEFCWLCSGDWKEHANRQCNVYRQEEIEQNQSSAREILNRYMHYFTRYQAHHQSLEFEDKLRTKVDERKREMQAGLMSYTDQQSIGKAFEVLQQCRRVLKYTYPFAFYLERNNQSEIFENNQADLERATEVLSGYLENEINADRDFAVNLMNKTSYCNQRRQILLNHCKEGYANNYWSVSDPN